RVSDGDWQPLKATGVSASGILPFKNLNTAGSANLTVTFRPLEPWQLHSVRARLITAVTALDLDKPVPLRARATVVVMPPTAPNTAALGLAEENTLCVNLSKEVTDLAGKKEIPANAGNLFRSLLRPTEEVTVAEANLTADERLFTGAWSQSNQIVASDSIRFALEKASQDTSVEGPPQDTCNMLLFKLVQKGNERKWTTKPWPQKKLRIGDLLGAAAVSWSNPFGGDDVSLDFSTPFKIEKIQTGVQRTWYWSITVKSKAAPEKGKYLDLKEVPMSVKTCIVTLKDTIGGGTKEYMQLNTIPEIKPKKDEYVYPLRLDKVDELAEFTKSPSEFVQRPLRPKAPTQFAKDQGPLPLLRAQ
ncbi:MAG: hypothetical protein AAB263_15560, partial [Planctomycetota bacterium]